MLKFFRKIRQGLLQEGSFQKYLLYAAGEILLVMIGILLALQVNNWNENRQNRKVEKEILTNIRAGLITDFEKTISSNIKAASEKATLAHALLNAAETDAILPDSLRRRYIGIGRGTTFQPITTPYKVFESKGLDIISNEQLRAAIINLYEIEYELVRTRISNEEDNKRDIYRPILRKYFKFYPPDMEYRYVPIDYNTMIKDRDFLNTITVLLANSLGNKELLEKLTLKIEEVIAQIDKELEQL